MALEQVTPVILTLNEAPNLGRTLARLDWARRIVVVDSFSEDETCEIARRHSNVELFQRRFDTHASQWNFATRETGITTPWTLALDADYQVTPELASEIGRRVGSEAFAGYRARFLYCVEGEPLRGTAYPPVTVLYRTGAGRYVQDGHTQRVVVEGAIADLEAPMLHDDRKPLAAWMRAQARYAALEADKLAAAAFAELGAADRVRRLLLLAPPAMLFHCLFIQGNALAGRRGLFYALQRTLSELMLSVFLLERQLRRRR